MDRFKASKQMLADMENSFDDTVLAVRRNRDDLTPLSGRSMKLKVRDWEGVDRRIVHSDA